MYLIILGGRSLIKKMVFKFLLGKDLILAEIELNTKIFKKDNLDIAYSITGKKLLNGILHYKIKIWYKSLFVFSSVNNISIKKKIE